jgi:hypothetical protein
LSDINTYQTVAAKKMGDGGQKSNTSHDRMGGANRISNGMYTVSIKMKTQSLLLFFGTWLVYLAFLSPGIYSIDGSSMLAVADSLVTHHDVTVPVGLGMKGQDGNSYSRWYLLQSLLAAPVVALASFARAGGRQRLDRAKLCCGRHTYRQRDNRDDTLCNQPADANVVVQHRIQ